jgi:hypothetical protein
MEAKFQVGVCCATVFANEVVMRGRPVVVRSVAVQRTYKDKDGRYQTSTSFPPAEVPKLVAALVKAYLFVSATPVPRGAEKGEAGAGAVADVDGEEVAEVGEA